MSSPSFQSRRPIRRPHIPRAGALTIVGACLVVAGLFIVDWKLRPAIAAGAQAVATRAANEALNRAVMEEMADNMNASRLLHVELDKQGDLRIADFDFGTVTRVQSESTLLADSYLEHLSKQTLRLPVSQTLGGVLFSTIGPTLPVKVAAVGSAHSSVKVEATTVGINQTVHVLYLDLSADVQVVAPLVTRSVTAHSRVPLAYVVFNGKVPNTYFGGKALPPISGSNQYDN